VHLTAVNSTIYGHKSVSNNGAYFIPRAAVGAIGSVHIASCIVCQSVLYQETGCTLSRHDMKQRCDVTVARASRVIQRHGNDF